MSKKNKRNDKGACQTKHAKIRCFQRFGIFPSNTEIQAIIKDIQEGTAKFLQKQTNRISVFGITFHGIEMEVCFDKGRKTLVTFLPPEGHPDYEEQYIEEEEEEDPNWLWG